MEDISADTVPQQSRDRDAARRERQARALEIVQRIGRPPEPSLPRPVNPRPVRERPEPEPEVGEVYFLYSCNRIKIGTSKNHIDRVLNGISPYCPAPLFLIGTILGGRLVEANLHARFRDAWIHSEWFDLAPELREFLCEDEDRSQKLTASEDHYFEWLLREIETQKENPVNEFAETRSMLKKLAMAHGPETDIGHDCHNLLEMTENYAKSTDEEQRRQLVANITRAKADLDAKLKKISQ